MLTLAAPIIESAWTAPIVAFIATLFLFDFMSRRARRRASHEVRRHNLAVRSKARRDRALRRRGVAKITRWGDQS